MSCWSLPVCTQAGSGSSATNNNNRQQLQVENTVRWMAETLKDYNTFEETTTSGASDTDLMERSIDTAYDLCRAFHSNWINNCITLIDAVLIPIMRCPCYLNTCKLCRVTSSQCTLLCKMISKNLRSTFLRSLLFVIKLLQRSVRSRVYPCIVSTKRASDVLCVKLCVHYVQRDLIKCRSVFYKAVYQQNLQWNALQ